MRYILDVRITCALVLTSLVPAGRETNGRVSRESGESLDVARNWKFTKVVFNKMVMGRTKEETDLQGRCYEWDLALEVAQCDVINTLISTKEEQKSTHNWKEETYDIMFLL